MQILQNKVAKWMQDCFGPIISVDKSERNFRFLEEALELVQACGCTKDEAHQLVDYVFNRPVGEKTQEVGGVMITLAALCNSWGININNCFMEEHDRITQPEMIERIRAKQAAKPQRSPLPGPSFPGGRADA